MTSAPENWDSDRGPGPGIATYSSSATLAPSAKVLVSIILLSFPYISIVSVSDYQAAGIAFFGE